MPNAIQLYLTSQNCRMSVSDEVEPEVYLWNSASTVSLLCVDFLLYTESEILNYMGAGLTSEIGVSLLGESAFVVATSDVDDFSLRLQTLTISCCDFRC